MGRIQPASCHRSNLTWVSSPPQKLVKSVSQLKDLQDVFFFRYKTQASGRKHMEGWEKDRFLLEGRGWERAEGRSPSKKQSPLITFGYTSLAIVLPCRVCCGAGAGGVTEGQ